MGGGGVVCCRCFCLVFLHLYACNLPIINIRFRIRVRFRGRDKVKDRVWVRMVFRVNVHAVPFINSVEGCICIFIHLFVCWPFELEQYRGMSLVKTYSIVLVMTIMCINFGR